MDAVGEGVRVRLAVIDVVGDRVRVTDAVRVELGEAHVMGTTITSLDTNRHSPAVKDCRRKYSVLPPQLPKFKPTSTPFSKEKVATKGVPVVLT